MKALTLTSSLIAALSLTAFGQSDTTLRSQITQKEKELVELQKELASLKSRLTSTSTTNSANYRVKTGDTISSISRRYGVSQADLMAWNKITDPTRLGIGETLTIKGAGTDVSEAPKAVRVDTPVTTSDYTIVSGDTFYSIARNHKLSVTQLRELNPDVSTHLITAGQKLRVSGTPSTSVAKVSSSTPAPATIKAPEVKAAKTTPPAVQKSSPSTIETKTSKIPSMVSTPTAKAPPPAPAPKKEVIVSTNTQTPEPPIPPAPPVVKEEKAASKASVASIILTEETTFDAFASKHGTSTTQLNALNGWNLPSATVLARGSEIYVPQ